MLTKLEAKLNSYQKIYALGRELEDLLMEQGYGPVEPAVFEDYDEFFRINDRISSRAAVKLQNTDGGMLLLSPDMTTGVMGRLMPLWEPGLTAKLFYSGKTYVHGKSSIRESRQMGAEYMGSSDISADLSIIGTVIDIMDRYLCRHVLEVGSSRFLKGVLEGCCFSPEEYGLAVSCLAAKDRQGLRALIDSVPYRDAVSILGIIFDLEGSLMSIEEKLEGLRLDRRMMSAVRELRLADNYLRDSTLRITYDLSMVTELGYYDGIIFRGYSDCSNKALIRGGRYDSFTRMFGVHIPAVGFSVDMDEMIAILYKDGEDL